MHLILWPIISWIFRAVVVKFIVVGAVLAVVSMLVPYAIEYLGSFIGVGSLTSSFASLPSGVWWFLDYFRLPFGLPLVISAFVGRFLIRRLPVIG